jgi:hypothetical protein
MARKGIFFLGADGSNRKKQDEGKGTRWSCVGLSISATRAVTCESSAKTKSGHLSQELSLRLTGANIGVHQPIR